MREEREKFLPRFEERKSLFRPLNESFSKREHRETKEWNERECTVQLCHFLPMREPCILYLSLSLVWCFLVSVSQSFLFSPFHLFLSFLTVKSIKRQSICQWWMSSLTGVGDVRMRDEKKREKKVVYDSLTILLLLPCILCDFTLHFLF